MFVNDFAEGVYNDFLYDCYIANLRLTNEDWEWYGKEEHHIELPERDGGVLTPLNSQPLTTYQHWIAGVWQSEILGKCCFACVPKGVLPVFLDQLRAKWQTHHAKEVNEKTGTKIVNNGKMWITDGLSQKLIHPQENIPTGWKRGRVPHSEETRRKISEKGKGRPTSEETRAKLRARPSAWKGRKHTPESKTKQSESAKNRKPHTRNTPRKFGSDNPNHGKKWFCNAEKTKEGMFFSGEQPEGWVLGKKIRATGHKLSRETKQKMQEAQRARRLKEKEGG